MKTKIFLLTLILCVSFGFAQDTDEKQAVKDVIQSAYVDGLQNEGDLSKIEAGFHPDFYLLGIDKGEGLWRYGIKEWTEKQLEKKANGELPLKGDKRISVKFKHVDITGNAASVKLDYYVGENHVYIDYLSLYKFDSGWKIVSKIFYKL